MIQQSIRKELSGCTLVVTAHRLSTVVDFDRILVLSAEQGIEWGSPLELMERSTEDGTESLFQKMVKESGEKELLERIIFRGVAPSD